jgi:hypothetical protein
MLPQWPLMFWLKFYIVCIWVINCFVYSDRMDTLGALTAEIYVVTHSRGLVEKRIDDIDWSDIN